MRVIRSSQLLRLIARLCGVGLLTLLLVLPALAQHVYYSGRLVSISTDRAEIPAGAYPLKPQVKVLLFERDSKGAYYYHPFTLSSIRTGDMVHLKVVNGQVVEIEVVRGLP